MGDAAALIDLGEVVLYFGRFILAALAFYLVAGIAAGLRRIPIIGGSLSGVADFIVREIADPLKADMKASEAAIAKGLLGIADSLAVLVGLFLVLGIGVKDALAYLWNEALRPLILGIVKPVRTLADEALAGADNALRTAAHYLQQAEQYAQGQANAAAAAARHFATAEIKKATDAVRSEFGGDIAKLQAAETQAVTHAMQVAADGIAAAKIEAESLFGQAEADAKALDAKTAATFTSALAGVKSIAVTAEDDLSTVLGNLSTGQVAAIIESVPLLATLVHTIAIETGLENQACRGKVKQVCATNPSQWTSLLTGLAAADIALNLREVVAGAALLAKPAAALLQELK